MRHGERHNQHKRVIFKGPWRKQFEPVLFKLAQQQSDGGSTPGHPWKGANREAERIDIYTLDGYLVSPSEIVIAGEPKTGGHKKLLDEMQQNYGGAQKEYWEGQRRIH